MNIYSILKNDIIKIFLNEYKENKLDNLKNLVVEKPKNKEHGDLSTNIALISAKQLKKSPQIIGKLLLPHLKQLEYIKSVSIAPNGFINFILKETILYQILNSVIKEEKNFGKSKIGNNQKINIEYVSANPTGPLHIGHTRGAIYGDVLANLMKFVEFDVTKEYYINDAGEQINQLVQSVYYRYLDIVNNTSTPIPEGLYPGEYLIPVAKKLHKEYSNKLKDIDTDKRNQIIKDISVEYMLDLIKQDLSLLNIKHDVFFSEQYLHDNNLIEKTIDKLKLQDLIYTDILKKPKGTSEKNWKERKQLLFKSSNLGDDEDRALTKANNRWTYFASDIAYADNKINRGFKKLIYILGADHGGYIARTKAAIHALSKGKVESDIKLCQLVKIIEDGATVKMSKRKGNFNSLKDLVLAVGPDATRFMMLTRKNDIELHFDIKKATEQSKDNPIFYIQYAHVRCDSLLRKISDINFNNINPALLIHPLEINLMKLIAFFPQMIKSSAISAEPHRIALYLIEIASHFHSLWNYYDNNGQYKFIDENNKNLTESRLYLVTIIKQIISNALNIIDIKPLNKM